MIIIIPRGQHDPRFEQSDAGGGYVEQSWSDFRTLIVSVSIYAADAWSVMQALTRSHFSLAVRTLLGEQTVIDGNGTITQVPGTGDINWREQYACSFTIRTCVAFEELVEDITGYLITGRATSDDGTNRPIVYES